MNPKKRILLVEDEVIIALAQKAALEKYGYDVTLVHTGEKAVETIEGEAPIDLVLMDIDLGREMDGTQAAKQILKKAGLPIVFLSSHTEPKIVEKTENITSYGYVVKNSSITVLDASIKMAFKLFYANQKTVESETQFSLFMDYLPAIAFLKDSAGRTLFMNKYMNTVLGSSGWMGKTMLEVFPDTFGEKLHSDDMEILKTGYKSMEEAIPHTDGTLHWYETQKFTVKKSKTETLIGGISLDITDRKRIEEALRESERRLLQAEKDRTGENK